MSVLPGYANMILDRDDAGYPAETTIAASDTATKAAGVTKSGGITARLFTVSTNNRVTCTSEVPMAVAVFANVSATAAGNNELIGIGFLKNGSAASSDIERFVSVGADRGAIGDCWITTMDTDDYIELYVINSTSTDNITLYNAHVCLLAVPIAS